MNKRAFRTALAELDISQADLAKILGVHANTVTAWVNADDIPGLPRLFIWIAREHGIEAAKAALRT